MPIFFSTFPSSCIRSLRGRARSLLWLSGPPPPETACKRVVSLVHPNKQTFVSHLFRSHPSSLEVDLTLAAGDHLICRDLITRKLRAQEPVPSGTVSRKLAKASLACRLANSLGSRLTTCSNLQDQYPGVSLGLLGINRKTI